MGDSEVLAALRKRTVDAKATCRMTPGYFARGAFHAFRLVLEWLDEAEAGDGRADEGSGEERVS